jgi:late competence protein required for DNA uptake (superfamily II DNA/RNA helicase)
MRVHTTSDCQRCGKPFRYYRTRRPRFYCRPCVKLERIDANAFFNALAAKRRREIRV